LYPVDQPARQKGLDLPYRPACAPSLLHEPQLISSAIKQMNYVMPELIRHPVFSLDSGFRRNDRFDVFSCRINKIYSVVPGNP
jgi:hypothetical protein